MYYTIYMKNAGRFMTNKAKRVITFLSKDEARNYAHQVGEDDTVVTPMSWSQVNTVEASYKITENVYNVDR